MVARVFKLSYPKNETDIDDIPTVATFFTCDLVEQATSPIGVRLTGISDQFVAGEDGVSFYVFYVLNGGRGSCRLSIEMVHKESGLCLGKSIGDYVVDFSSSTRTGAIYVDRFQFTGEFEVYLLINGKRMRSAQLTISKQRDCSM